MNRVLRASVAAGCCAAMCPATATAAMSSGDAAFRLGIAERQLAQRADLPLRQLRVYVKGAQAVGGLDARSVLKTLRRPELMRAVPVSIRTGSRTVKVAASFARRGCRFTESFVVSKSAAKIALWRFGVRKYWCWNRDTRRVDANPKVFVDVRVPQAAAISGWRYDGIDKNGKYDNLFRWRDKPRGAHLTIRRGVFKWCPPRIACFNTRRPTIAITGYYDGHVTDRRSIG